MHSAARHNDRAVALAPEDVEALRTQSVIYKILGRVEDAIRMARQATECGPGLALVWNGLGDVLLAAGRNAEAIDALKRALSIQPGYVTALERLEIAWTRLGELELAVELRASRHKQGGHLDRAEQLARDVKDAGAAEAMQRDLRRELDILLQQAERNDPFADSHLSRTTADQIVVTYAALGEWHRAMDWVERAYDRRPIRLRRMLTDPPFDRRGLAVDPRYARLLRVAVLEDLM